MTTRRHLKRYAAWRATHEYNWNKWYSRDAWNMAITSMVAEDQRLRGVDDTTLRAVCEVIATWPDD